MHTRAARWTHPPDPPSTPPRPHQVVAGTNFFFELTVRDAAGKTSRVQARVSQALPVYGGAMTLTGYQVL